MECIIDHVRESAVDPLLRTDGRGRRQRERIEAISAFLRITAVVTFFLLILVPLILENSSTNNNGEGSKKNWFSKQVDKLRNQRRKSLDGKDTSFGRGRGGGVSSGGGGGDSAMVVLNMDFLKRMFKGRPRDRWSVLREEIKEFREMAARLVKLHLPNAVSSFARMVMWVAVSSIVSKGISDFINYLENKIPIGRGSSHRHFDPRQYFDADDWAEFRGRSNSTDDVGIDPI
mmetsp:Transcript_22788/g.31885  ORF Transcript_22788/g.31885 Transcript_22788/m.31885 type:complete len:231 (-) Transcript_22788:168-860(-)|eukprot:CAMPEP_0185251994 /NCGR_PEP_ID=MMETSP1359-20130426/1251_1 /TAXON_ID=552665 /ORGANISM="Bigelowiella longifila, Strain CCMP242" /LENGTH=230 /DNA_ID=CAMNT_0027834069 /DNA_START=180 /DNA_END=872 /DNA_ORIENTATION=-